MISSRGRRLSNLALACVALAAIGFTLWRLAEASSGVAIERLAVDGTPVTIVRPSAGPSGPVVVIAHGFAGSQQLMRSFALTFACNGYVAVTFDFAGHGRNPRPLSGGITEESGATRTLLAELTRVADAARGLGDGRLAVLGHSMASDVVVRFAEATPDVAATVAVSMFSPAVTASAPRNLLVIVGDWEAGLKQEALRAVGLAIGPREASPGITYGDVAAGTSRRAAFSAHVEHASVLFSQDSMREALAWLDATFGIVRTRPPALDDRGPWIMLLLGAVVLLARPLSACLPRLAEPAIGAGLGWRRLAVPLLVPMIATPLLLRVMPTHFLPVLVGDYLAAHFALYGLITILCLVAMGRPIRLSGQQSGPGFWLATAAVVAYGFVGFVWPIDRLVTSFMPGPERVVLVLAMLVGTLLYFVGDEWSTRGQGAGRAAYAVSKLVFLASLAVAVGLDFRRLFFLVIIVPVIGLFFLVYGLISAWVYRSTGHPLVAAIASAIAFAWAIGVTFPLLAG